MKRSMCGLVLLTAATGLWSCNGDPTESFRTGEKVVADPTTVFVDQGASKFVTVEVLDDQGNQLAGDFATQNVGANITVVRDTTFLQTTTGAPILTSARYVITGVTPGSTSFDVTSGGATTTVPVRVVPTSFAALFSNEAPAANEPVTITLPAGFRFVAGAGATTDQGAAIVQSFSVDSTAITVLLPPGSTGPVTIVGVQAAFLPGVTLAALPTDASVTVGPVVPLAGTGATGTAPALTIPAVGETVAFFDGGTYDYPAPLFGGAFGTFPSRLYKITVAATTTLTTTVDWAGTQDFGIYFFASNGTTDFGTAGDGATADVKPETTTNTFPAGTYYLAVVNFSPTNPPFFSLTVTGEANPAP